MIPVYEIIVKADLSDGVHLLRTGIITTSLDGENFETCVRHKKRWPEMDNFEEFGGKACKECIEKAKTIYRN